MGLVILVGVIALVLTVLYFLSIRTRSPNAVIMPGGLPIIGHALMLKQIEERMLEWLHGGAIISRFKPFQFSVPSMGWFICILEPDHVQHVLEKNFKNYVKGEFFREQYIELFGDGIFGVDGAKWTYQRKTASHMFSRNGLRNLMADVFVTDCDIVVDYIKKKEGRFDLQDVFYRYTLEGIGQIAFGVSLGCFEDGDAIFQKHFDRAQQIVMLRLFDPLWPIRKHAKWLFPVEWRLTESIKVLQDFSAKVIRERRGDADYKNRDDLLSRFLSERDEDGNPLSDERLRDVIMAFIIAGRDTTANCLSWAFYELYKNPHTLEKLRQEIETILQGQPATYDDVADRLPYLHAVVQETLRLHPSVPKDAKVAVADDVLPDGTKIPANAKIIYLPYVMGRMESLWPDAHKFDPERWLAPDFVKPSHFKYTAFNAGPRLCLGMNMAYLEAQFLIVALLQNFDIEVEPGQDFSYSVTLTMPLANGLYVTAKPRN